MDTQHVTLIELAEELGLDRSNMRKYALKQGFNFLQVRTAKSRGQLALALTEEDAEALRAIRAQQGFINQVPVSITGQGLFYIVFLAPDLSTRRIKLGYTSDINHRLNTYRTLSPTVSILKIWLCKESWEQVAIESVTRIDCIHIGGEVYDCEDIDSLLTRADEFFSILPSLSDEGEKQEEY